MKKLFLLSSFIFLFVAVNCQTIKLKIPSITPLEGETVLAFETSDTTLTNTSSGGGGGSVSVPRFEPVKIKKLRGLSTNELFKRSVNGTLFPEVDFEFYDSTNTLFYKIVIRDVSVGHFSWLSPECANCSTLSHQVWFDGVRIEVTDVATGNTTRYNRSTRAIY